MKVKTQSQGQGQFDSQGGRQWANGQYGQKKNKSRKKLVIGNRIGTQPNGRTSTYSSSSRLTSFLKGQSMSEAQIFKGSESAIYNQLAEKYVPRGTAPQKVKEEMQLVLQRKKSEIEALRVHRDQLKFMSYNNPYDMPIKISLAVLKQKARAQERIRDTMLLLQRDIKEIEFEFNTMTDYYNFISNAIKSNGEEDLIIDTQEEEQLMIDNLQKETNHLFRELKEEDKKNAKQIKSMQEQIGLLRVYIKQKQDTIRDLKSKICTLHIKLHSRAGSTSKEKSLSLSVRKFITEQNYAIQEAFVGNNSFKGYSKELLQKKSLEDQFTKITFFFEAHKQILNFRCSYKDGEGKMHRWDDELHQQPNQVTSPPKPKKAPKVLTVKVKYLLSIKFFFKSKIVGLECRIKTDKGTQLERIGNCDMSLQHELLTLINKRVVTLGSYWHNKQLIGIGLWFCARTGLSRNNSRDKDQGDAYRTPKSKNRLKTKEQQNNDYYQT